MNKNLLLALTLSFLVFLLPAFGDELSAEIVVTPSFTDGKAVILPDGADDRFVSPEPGVMEYDGTEDGTKDKWDALYISDYGISGDGYIEFRIKNNINGVMVGFKTDKTVEERPTYGLLNFAVYLTGNNYLALYQSGLPLENGLEITNDDLVCRIERANGVITYKIGDNLFVSDKKSEEKFYLTFAMIGDNKCTVYDIKIVGMY